MSQCILPKPLASLIITKLLMIYYFPKKNRYDSLNTRAFCFQGVSKRYQRHETTLVLTKIKVKQNQSTKFRCHLLTNSGL